MAQQFPIVGYYQAGHKWLPVTVNEDGNIVFRQDPQTALEIAQLRLAIDTLAQYVHDAGEENTNAIQSALATMLSVISNATTDITNRIETMESIIDLALTDQQIDDIVNTSWS